jgi:hypothetical protein
MDIIDYIEIFAWAEIVLIGMVSVMQPTKSIMNLNLVYWATLIFHAVLFKVTSDNIPDKQLWFYVLGGTFDLFIIFYTYRMEEISRVVAGIQDVSIVSILFNLLGLFLSYIGGEPEMYMLLFVMLYARAIYVLIKGEPMDVGYFKVDTRWFAFDRNAHKRMLFNSSEPKKK